MLSGLIRALRRPLASASGSVFALPPTVAPAAQDGSSPAAAGWRHHLWARLRWPPGSAAGTGGVEQRELPDQPASPGDTQDVGCWWPRLCSISRRSRARVVKRYGRLGSWSRRCGASKRITSMAGRVHHERLEGSSRMPMPLHAGAEALSRAWPDRDAQRRPARCMISSRTWSSLTVMSIPPRHAWLPAL